jgi:hypothetical protein
MYHLPQFIIYTKHDSFEQKNHGTQNPWIPGSSRSMIIEFRILSLLRVPVLVIAHKLELPAAVVTLEHDSRKKKQKYM